MINAADVVTDPLKVIDYADPSVAAKMASGKINTDVDVILKNIASSIRRGHPQIRLQQPQPERICLVGSGPSLDSTLPELRELLWNGAVLVTMNGSYHWCIERNLQPKTQVVMDARPSNARFVVPDVPKCNYVLASQCASEVWDAVEGRQFVRIFHAVVKGKEDASQLLDDYYQKNWLGVGGGTTVASRAINMFRMCGYMRFDLFGVDCCWTGDAHHAMPQPENDRDKQLKIVYGVPGDPSTEREFVVAPWMLKQFEDMLTIMKINGKHFQLEVHGNGLLAYAMRTLGAEGAISSITDV